MRILVTGSRDWNNWAVVHEVLDTYLWPLTIVHGACPSGVDAYADLWVSQYAAFAVYGEPHPADWATHGKAAGFIRNMEMVKAGADRCLAFIRNNSPGASHCRSLALAAGIEVRTYRENEQGLYLGRDFT